LVLSAAKNCYAKDRLWKSAVREISLAVHATFGILKFSNYLVGVKTSPLPPLNPPLDYEQLNVFK